MAKTENGNGGKMTRAESQKLAYRFHRRALRNHGTVPWNVPKIPEHLVNLAVSCVVVRRQVMVTAKKC